MIACQHHRGPDSEGFHIDPACGVGLGHVRLSIIDLSAAAAKAVDVYIPGTARVRLDVLETSSPIKTPNSRKR